MTFVELSNNHLASVAPGLTLFCAHTNLNNNLNKYTTDTDILYRHTLGMSQTYFTAVD